MSGWLLLCRGCTAGLRQRASQTAVRKTCACTCSQLAEHFLHQQYHAPLTQRQQLRKHVLRVPAPQHVSQPAVPAAASRQAGVPLLPARHGCRKGPVAPHNGILALKGCQGQHQ